MTYITASPMNTYPTFGCLFFRNAKKARTTRVGMVTSELRMLPTKRTRGYRLQKPTKMMRSMNANNPKMMSYATASDWTLLM